MQIVFFWSMRFVTSLIINGGQLQFLVGAPENGDKVLHIFFIIRIHFIRMMKIAKKLRIS